MTAPNIKYKNVKKITNAIGRKKMFSINRKYRWLFLFILCFGMTGLFGVPYLTRGFYNVFQDATGVTNEQIGLLMSTYGLINLVLYFIGGWLADKVSLKKLLVFSYIGSGALGFVMLGMKSFMGLVLVYAGFSVTTGLAYFPAMLKFIRTLGDDSEQGLLYGLKEAGYAFFGIIVGFIVVRIGVVSGSDAVAFRWLVILYSVLSIAAGLLFVILLKDEKPQKDGTSEPINVKLVGKLLKVKEVWLITISIFCCYLVYSSLTYSSPYLVDVYGISNSTASTLGIIRQYVASSFVCLIYGVVADKIGSSVKMVNITFVGLAVTCIAFAMIPQGAAFVGMAIALMIAITILACGVRGVYYAQVSEAGFPIEYTGTVLGIIAILAFTPDAFYFTVMGRMLDRYVAMGNPAAGYHIIFMISGAAAVVGIVAGAMLYKSCVEKKKEKVSGAKAVKA
jgi:sugar phosphate permease